MIPLPPVEPHFVFDAEDARKRALKECSRGVIKSFRDESGKKSMLAVKDQKGRYVDISRCTDKQTLKKVIEQLRQKYSGIGASLNKAERRQIQLEGQLTLFEKHG